MKACRLLLLLCLVAAPVQAQRFVRSMNTLAQLIASNPHDINTNVFVHGRLSPNDGFQGTFYFVNGSTFGTNMGTVFATTHSGSTGRWFRLYDGELSVKWFGARGDGAPFFTPTGTDDYQSLTNAINIAALDQKALFWPDGVYMTSKPLIVDGSTGSNYRPKWRGESSWTKISHLTGSGIFYDSLIVITNAPYQARFSDLEIQGSEFVTNAVRLDHVAQSYFDHIKARDALESGFYISDSVLNQFDSCTVTQPGLFTRRAPKYGFRLTQLSNANMINNPVVENLWTNTPGGAGIFIEGNSNNNQINAGSSEFNYHGIYITNSQSTVVIATDMESNHADQDVLDAGKFSQYVNVLCTKELRFAGANRMSKVQGGRFGSIYIESTVRGAYLETPAFGILGSGLITDLAPDTVIATDQYLPTDIRGPFFVKGQLMSPEIWLPMVANTNRNPTLRFHRFNGLTNEKEWRLYMSSANGDLRLEALTDPSAGTSNQTATAAMRFLQSNGVPTETRIVNGLFVAEQFMQIGPSGNTSPKIISGTGNPEGVITAPQGSIFLRTDGAFGTTVYRKIVGDLTTGWYQDNISAGITAGTVHTFVGTDPGGVFIDFLHNDGSPTRRYIRQVNGTLQLINDGFSASVTAFNNDGSIDINSLGVRLSTDSDGMFTITGLGDGNDEDLSWNLDDTANQVVVTSSTGVTNITHTAIDLRVPDSAYSATEWDGNTAVPTMNALRDKIEALIVGGGAITGTDTHVMFFDGIDNPAGEAGFTYVKATDIATLVGGLNLHSTGVKLSGDGDGALTILGLGDGSDEDLTINLDDTSNNAVFTSSTGLTNITLTAINLTVPAASYDATAWDGNNTAPTRDDIRDAIENFADVDDTAFASSWDSSLDAPSKNAVYDWGHTFDTDDDGLPNVLDSTFTFSGFSITGDGDGAMTFLGAGDGSDEDLTINLDDTANQAVVTTSTGLTNVTFTAIHVRVPSVVYDATAWDGNTAVPTMDAIRDKIETLGGGSVDDTAFAATWNAVTTTAPSKNAVYDWGHLFDTDDDGKVNVLDQAAGIAITDASGILQAPLASTGTGDVVRQGTPTLTTPVIGAATGTSLALGADPADAGVLRLENAAVIGWEASPAGTDVTLTVDASEIMQASGTFNAATLTEGGTAVPNTGDNLSVFAATTSAQLAGVLSDEEGSGGGFVRATSPTITTPTISGAISLPDNTRQTFNPGADAAGLNVGSHAGDPGTPTNGDVWYDSTANELTARINGSNVALGAGGGGGMANTELSTNYFAFEGTSGTANSIVHKYPDPERKYRFEGHFDGHAGGNSILSGLGSTTATGGAVAFGDTTVVATNHIGVIRLDTGTTTNGRAHIYLGSPNANQLLLGTGGAWFKVAINLPTLSTAAETYRVYIGYGDVFSGDMTDGVYFVYEQGISDNWQVKTAAAGSRDAVITTTAVATGWTTLLGVVERGGATARFYINGTEVVRSSGDTYPITADIPTGTTHLTGFQITMAKVGGSTGTTRRDLYADWAVGEIRYD